MQLEKLLFEYWKMVFLFFNNITALKKKIEKICILGRFQADLAQ